MSTMAILVPLYVLTSGLIFYLACCFDYKENGALTVSDVLGNFFLSFGGFFLFVALLMAFVTTVEFGLVKLSSCVILQKQS
jgi:hypothetical protein